MRKFIGCGELDSTKGKGFNPPCFLKIKNGIHVGDFDGQKLKRNGELFLFIKDSKLNFPVEINKVVGFFKISNLELISLKGCPKEVEGSFDCSDNKLESLEGAPEKVGGSFYCNNNKLTSLEGAPKEVGGTFYCEGNKKLTSLKGCPKYVDRNFYCGRSARKFTEEEVRAVCNVKGRVIV